MTAPARRHPRPALRRRRGAALLVAGALVLAGCGPSEAELEALRLAESVDATFGAPFSFQLTLDADERAFAALEERSGPLATLLASLELEGTVVGEQLALQLAAMQLDVLELRVLEPGEVYVRSDLAGLVELLGSPASVEAQLSSRLTRAGADPAVVEAARAIVRGDWIRLATAPAPTPEVDDAAGAGGAIGATLRGLLRAATVTGHVGSLDVDDAFDGQLTVAIDPTAAQAAIAAVLGGLDPTGAAATALEGADADGATAVRGRVLVTGGIVRSVTLDLSSALAEARGTTATGDLSLVLEVTRATDAELVEVPADAVALDVAQLEAVVAAIGAALGEVAGGPAAGDGP